MTQRLEMKVVESPAKHVVQQGHGKKLGEIPNGILLVFAQKSYSVLFEADVIYLLIFISVKWLIFSKSLIWIPSSWSIVFV